MASGTFLEVALTTAQNDLDIITGTAGAILDSTATSAQLVGDVWSASGRALSDPAGFKKNTQADLHFKMLDSSGDPVSGLTVTAERAIDSGSFSACANSVSEISDGFYKITLAAADLNGDIVSLKFTGAGASDQGVTIKTET